jgi:UDP-N-acetylmuramoyl-L-alanyl-D-glutamate--2,6-diaminopimelate ligase
VKLAELAAGVPGAVVESGGEVEVGNVVQDSRRARPGDLFVAVRGLRADGHDFAAEVAARGVAVAVERPLPLPAGAAVLRLADTRAGLAELAAELHGRPSRRLLVVGVTGTDGKTTTAHLAAHVLRSAGLEAGLMSTVAFALGGAEADNPTGLSTAGPPEVQAGLARMVEAGARCAVLEVTSHALVQERVAACDFDAVGVTNVGVDHLDYHRTWEDYLAAKARLVDLCAAGAPKGVPKTAVLNLDDRSFEPMAAHSIERRWSYSMGATSAHLRAAQLSPSLAGTRFRLLAPGGEAAVELPLPARYNVANALCAAGLCLALGLDLGAVAAGLSSFPGLRGRLEPVDLGQPFRVFVDYAHSASSLASALRELRPFTQGRLIAVFGSTARADHDRPGMGRAAAAGADFFVITTDDPVDEDPAEIARQVSSGVEGRRPGQDFEVVLDRRAAIRRAIGLARPGDVVLLAGKGHERTMVTAAGREPWDERAEAEAALREFWDR